MSLHFKGPILADANAGAFANYPIELTSFANHMVWEQDFANQGDYLGTNWTETAIGSPSANTISTTQGALVVLAGGTANTGNSANPKIAICPEVNAANNSFAFESRVKMSCSASPAFAFTGMAVSGTPPLVAGGTLTGTTAFGFLLSLAGGTITAVARTGSTTRISTTVSTFTPATSLAYTRFGIRLDRLSATSAVFSAWVNGVRQVYTTITTASATVNPVLTSLNGASTGDSLSTSADYMIYTFPRL